MTYSAGSADPGAQARETLMPTAHAAILQLWAAYQRLIELGWQPPPRWSGNDYGPGSGGWASKRRLLTRALPSDAAGTTN